MSDQACDCCEPTVDQSTERIRPQDRWLNERVTNAPLPPDVANLLGQFLGEESIETLDDFVIAAREATGGSLSIDDLCHAGRETSHRAVLEGETYHFLCFLDAIVLTHLTEKPIDIYTESPANETIEMRALPNGDVDASPSDEVMSFGITADVKPPTDERLSSEEAFTAMCPYVKAFPTREAYERWAESVDAATVGMSLAAGVEIAVALVE
jgi:alkylmercury lyase